MYCYDMARLNYFAYSDERSSSKSYFYSNTSLIEITKGNGRIILTLHKIPNAKESPEDNDSNSISTRTIAEMHGESLCVVKFIDATTELDRILKIEQFSNPKENDKKVFISNLDGVGFNFMLKGCANTFKEALI